MRQAAQTHLDHGGDFSGERYFSAGLIKQLIEQVLQQASSLPLDLFIVPQHKVHVILTVDLHHTDSRAGHHLQLPHDRRYVLLILDGKNKEAIDRGRHC